MDIYLSEDNKSLQGQAQSLQLHLANCSEVVLNAAPQFNAESSNFHRDSFKNYYFLDFFYRPQTKINKDSCLFRSIQSTDSMLYPLNLWQFY